MNLKDSGLQRQAENACEVCKYRKQRCNKALPSCASCEKRLYPCKYGEADVRKTVRSLRRQLQGLERLVSFRDESQLPVSAVDLQTIHSPEPYPVSSSYYMRQLIRHFREDMLPGLTSSQRNNTSAKLRTVWLQAAFMDPCMFHATLYAASAHLDMIQEQVANPITIFHRGKTLRLINECLTNSEAAVRDGVLGAIVTLTTFEKVVGNFNASMAHRRGLRQIVALRGGLGNLGLDGLLADLINMDDIWETLAHGFKSTVPASNESLELRSFLALALSSADMDLLSVKSTCCISPETFYILRDIRDATIIFENSKRTDMSRDEMQSDLDQWSRLQNRFTAPESAEGATPRRDQEIYDCCRSAALIHWNSLIRLIPLDSDSHQPYVTALRKSLSNMDIQLWLRTEPETFVWVCLTGVVAVKSAIERAWFVAQVGPVLMGMAGGDTLRSGIAHFQWLRLQYELGVGCIDTAHIVSHS